ncbi:MAG TPA: hypothetical protein VI583_17245, partial [Cyclobacteriaceae bacterium]|nr:hypothetical protein [Cyclobacteriaceae bacterium]
GKTGKWTFQAYVKDAGGTGKTGISNFDIVDSEHHGWIRPSRNNPHYFVHDDGSSYYAVGVYSPWRNNAERFRKFADHKANFFAIWDIGYGGFVNETGIIEEELGKYNQEKLGRIDSMLSILEASDIQLMYAIWPHDLFSETVWAAEWDKNPYREICDVVDVYSDEVAWKYQMRKYRYMIARFAHSRSLGIWELINEMNGTDGWKEGRHQDAYDWVEKCDKFFEENDPYNHPVTASFSGGYEEYREPLYLRNDIPNIHFYPAQGWALKYPADTLRSSLYNYVFASRRFWDSFDKPAIFGEAGADLHYFNTRSAEYREDYHNGLWATLSNGLAGTPVWWDYTVLTDSDWEQLSHLSVFVSDIDFANLDLKPVDIAGDGIDAYAMMSANSGFGWARSYVKNDISRISLPIKTTDGNYAVRWYDAWNGEYLNLDKVNAVNSILTITVPKLSTARKDIAFKIDRMPD